MRAKDISDRIISKIQTIYEPGEAKALDRILLEELFNLSTSDVIVNREVKISQKLIEDLDTILDRLLSCEPIQHILGFAWFMGDKFLVSPDVLIPRQETEELVDLIVKETALDNPVVLDIGTGSGCIPIALKKKLPKAQVHASEVSKAALRIASNNAERLKQLVTFHHSDILSAFPPVHDLDIIVSNPPYVMEKEKEDMSWNVLDHEPEIALFVSDDDPLSFYRVIAHWGLSKLKKGGKLYFEINERFGLETQAMMSNHPVKR